jgi:adenylate cyclase class IV
MHIADELEVKAPVPDPAIVRQALERAGARLEFRGAMLDRRFDRNGVMRARDEVLRLRTYVPADGAPAYGVLGWKGPPSAAEGYRRRAEVETRVADAAATLAILENSGFTVAYEIHRTVEVYRLAGAVVRLEWYPAMDVLIEVEGEPAAIEQAVTATGLPRESFVAESLEYFVAAYEARTGRAARVSGAP